MNIEPDNQAATDTDPWAREVDGYTALEWELTGNLRWRTRDDGYVELYIPDRDDWRRLRRHYGAALAGLDAGETLGEVHRRIVREDGCSDERARAVLKKTLSRLKRYDLLTVHLPPVPEVFDGRYERVEELGRGGMGVVWLCRDLEASDERLVAVKHAWNWKGSFKKRERYLREEAEVLSELDHPDIVEVYGTFEEEGRFHMAREYVPGLPMSELVRREDLEPEDRLRFLQVLADTAVHLLENGWMFLDFKPGNYFVSPSRSTVKLGDVGVCAPLPVGRREVKGLLATRSYNPPDAFQQRRVNETTLVYVLGASTCQLVARRTPGVTKSSRILEDRIPRIRDLMQQRGATELELLFFEQCCHPDPSERPQTLDEAITVLNGDPATV